jgi:3-oxoacyl-[acyl-carrier protein] reductase
MASNGSSQRRVALVFGGSRGIGAAIGRRLARDGFDVGLTYVSRPDKAQEVVSAIEAAGGKALAIAADSTDPQALRAAVAQTTERFGPLDVAVINAGVFRMGPIDSFSVEDLDLLISVNVRGVYLAIQAAVAGMRDGGRIVTIGSNVAIRTGMPGASAYAMTKGAVATLMRNAALELAPRRITVNDVQPGPTETDMTAGLADQIVGRVPLGRLGKPEEIAGLVSYLAGGESAFMTGANLTIDGGYVL